ncbi:MAG: hypothetical protein JST63_04885 [Bacteroidetes bacterium]|nr:hypothetical protein [Bacteroidota bacterium]
MRNYMGSGSLFLKKIYNPWTVIRWYTHGILLIIFLCTSVVKGQEIQGVVYDITQKIPLQGVSVISSAGYGTQTDSLGIYSIRVTPADSIWFSYLGKATPKYPVKSITNPAAFDISIQIYAVELPGVTIRQPNYHFDSLQNRREYEKVFNYRKPGLRISTLPPSAGGGVGVDLDEIVNLFRFRRNKNLKFLQEWLIKEEQEKYIDHRFTKIFVRKLTNLDNDELDSFMKFYRPSYSFLVPINEAELGLYILYCYEEYNRNGRRLPEDRSKYFKY